MNRLVFHNNFLHLTDKKEVFVELDSISSIFNYLKISFPKFNSKAINTQSYSLLIDGKDFIPPNWIVQNKIIDKECTIYIVPLVVGGGTGAEAAVALTASEMIGAALVKAAVSVLINLAVSAVIQALMPKPGKRAEQQSSPDSANRPPNDIFGNIVNTIDSGTTTPLNYGMIRLGGHYISADIETITQQKGVATPAISSSVTVETGTQPGTASETLPRFGGASDA